MKINEELQNSYKEVLQL